MCRLGRPSSARTRRRTAGARSPPGRPSFHPGRPPPSGRRSARARRGSARAARRSTLPGVAPPCSSPPPCRPSLHLARLSLRQRRRSRSHQPLTHRPYRRFHRLNHRPHRPLGHRPFRCSCRLMHCCTQPEQRPGGHRRGGNEPCTLCRPVPGKIRESTRSRSAHPLSEGKRDRPSRGSRTRLESLFHRRQAVLLYRRDWFRHLVR